MSTWNINSDDDADRGEHFLVSLASLPWRDTHAAIDVHSSNAMHVHDSNMQLMHARCYPSASPPIHWTECILISLFLPLVPLINEDFNREQGRTMYHKWHMLKATAAFSEILFEILTNECFIEGEKGPLLGATCPTALLHEDDFALHITVQT